MLALLVTNMSRHSYAWAGLAVLLVEVFALLWLGVKNVVCCVLVSFYRL